VKSLDWKGGYPVNAEEFNRKLTAILSADVEGYSRLMSQDEVGTIRILTAYREAMTTIIEQYKGRVVDSIGDNLLAEFASVVDAVNCAVEIQRELAERNAEIPSARKMQFRIGVNLGDVVEEEERIYGDGVNIAARIESLSDAGGISISGTVYDQVKNKLGLEYEYLGEQSFKNIPEPVRVYRVLSSSGAAPQIEPASVDRMAFPLPDAPSIAVLPFTNLSGDPGQDYLVDGITENIITALSKAPRLFVIARNSTFTYKGKAVKVQQVAEDLGVRYVLEGSIQRSGDRIRVTAQLIDALSGRHLGAERYDRDLKDLFAFQDEIALQILNVIQVKLTEGDQARWKGGSPQKVETELKHLEAMGLFQQYTQESNAIAKRLAEEMIGEDPKSHLGYIPMALTLVSEPWYGSTTNPKETFDQAVEMAQKAIVLGAQNGGLHAMLAYIYAMRREYDKAIAEGELAVQIEPSGADAILQNGTALTWAGRAKEAIPHIEKGLRLNPYPPMNFYTNAGNAYLFSGQHEKALTYYRKAKLMSPSSPMGYRGCAAAYALLGRQDEARTEAEEVMRLEPSFSLERFDKILPYCPAYRVILVSALRKAGLT
jgi:adenylate cyclase